ncbi:2-acylglycerol O-acyltransferase 1 isoform X1 [Procambarus clarkii]|uniref:2-acylglycerol O-acyltransferase 1 isoform X1 n=2 Tax=Procambarus clarkii TaxID=6728 RepID=UPI0037443FE7
MIVSSAEVSGAGRGTDLSRVTMNMETSNMEASHSCVGTPPSQITLPAGDASTGNQKMEEISLANQNNEFLPPKCQEIEDIMPKSLKMGEIATKTQQEEDIFLNNANINNISSDAQKAEFIPLSDKGSQTEQYGMEFKDNFEQKQNIEKQNNMTNEESNEKSKLTKDEEEDLKRYNRKMPEDRSALKKDKIEEHFDRLPWVFGAIGRVLNFGISHGPQFAPLNIPFSRRLQTLAVLFWMSTFLFMGAGSLIFLIYLFLYTEYWWVSLCYLTWFLGDRTIRNRGGRRIEWVRRWCLWKHYRDFFPIHLIKTAELDPYKNYIMGYHPHGILAAGAFCHFATEGSNFSKTFRGITPHLLTLDGHFHLPFYREFFMASGAVSATRESMDYLLGQEGSGRALCLVVGGAKESLDCHPGSVVLHLNKRKGFCKMALRHGASLVPMFSFGENEIYDQVANPEGSLIRRIQNNLQKVIGLAPCMFIGRGVFQYSFGIVPFRKPIYTVVGSPIDVPVVKNPTKEQIVGLHETYVNAVISLYNKYKHKYSEYPECEIKIV